MHSPSQSDLTRSKISLILDQALQVADRLAADTDNVFPDSESCASYSCAGSCPDPDTLTGALTLAEKLVLGNESASAMLRLASATAPCMVIDAIEADLGLDDASRDVAEALLDRLRQKD